MPNRRTFSGLTRDFNRVAQENERLQHQRDEAIKAADEVKKKNKRLKKALKKDKKQTGDRLAEPLIPKPDGQAGRKTVVDGNGRTRQGFNLRTEMGLAKPEDKKTYNEFRELVRRAVPGDKYKRFEDMGPVVVGTITLKASTSFAIGKFPLLSKFQGHWPVEVVLRSYFTNRTNYKKDGKKKRGGDEGGATVDEDDDADAEPEEVDTMSAAGDGSDKEDTVRRGYGETDEDVDGWVAPKRKWAVVMAEDSDDETPPAPKRKRPNSRIPSYDAEDSAVEDPASDSTTDPDEESATNPAGRRHRQTKSPPATPAKAKATNPQRTGPRRSTRKK